MKKYITLLSMPTGGYRVLETVDSTFSNLYELFTNNFKPGELLDWLKDETDIVNCTSLVRIIKEKGEIALYDISAGIDSRYVGVDLDPTKRFVMSISNFEEILQEWERLRKVSPEKLLVVLHEDDYVSLESDREIMQQYINAGYAFDCSKERQKIKEFMFIERFEDNYIDSIFSNVTSLLYILPPVLEIVIVEKKILQDILFVFPKYWFEKYIYHDKEKDRVYIGEFELSLGGKGTLEHDLDKIAEYVKFPWAEVLEMSYENYVELIMAWQEIVFINYSYVMVYRDYKDWLICKGYNSKKEMIDFVKNNISLRNKMIGEFRL